MSLTRPDRIQAALAEIAKRCPIDFQVWALQGDNLTLRAGRSSSSWSDFEVVFEDVSYLELPMSIDQVTIVPASEAVRERVRAAFDMLDPDSIVFEIVEEPWRDAEGRTVDQACYAVVADGLRFERSSKRGAASQ